MRNVDTPRPRKRVSPGTSSQRALAPVATITVSAVYSSSSVVSTNGVCEKSTFVTSVKWEYRSEALRLFAEVLHQIRTHDALGKTGEVLDLSREHQLTAVEMAREDDGCEVGAGGVDGGGEAGGARSR